LVASCDGKLYLGTPSLKGREAGNLKLHLSDIKTRPDYEQKKRKNLKKKC